MIRAERALRCIEPGEWPAATTRPRVLLENPDGAETWAQAETLRNAGYDVAVCTGPIEVAGRRRPGYFEEPAWLDRNARTLCPLVAGGRCGLVDGADVVVSIPELGEVVAAIRQKRGPDVIVEGTDGAIPLPVTKTNLLAAVAAALSRGADATV
jgi:hypothetical protein